jgi:REP element-mobilizing transposase RayT
MLDGLFRRRRLPHWDVEDGIYFVTTCLAGSIPAQGIVRLQRYRQELDARTKPTDLTGEEWEYQKQKLMFARFDHLIDCEPAVNHLETPAAAELVRNALYHFAGERYDLLAFAVMPSHVHWVFHPRAAWVQSLNDLPRRTPRERIVKSIKGYTAKRCNQLFGTAGSFWQDEAYDHVVRDDEELLRIVEYVEQNPVKARLATRPELWRWSSAADRCLRGGVPGEFLLK